MTAERAFEITYTMTSWDYAAMTRFVMRRPLWRGLVVLALWLVAVWCLIAYSTGVYNPVTLIRGIMLSGQAWFFILVLALFAFFALMGHWLMWALSFLYYRQLAAADATITMALTEEGIEGTSTIADTKVPWSTVKRVVRAPTYLFLPISKREAFVFPRRAFESEAQFEAAYRFAEAHVTKA